MKKLMRIFLALIVVLTVTTLSAYAERGGYYRHGGGYGGGHGGFGLYIGPGWVGPGWWGPYSYPYYPSYPAPPVIIQQQPEIYVQPTPQVEAPSYWYYCQEPQGYYPYVKKCPKGWMKVVPPATSPGGEE